MMRIRAAPLTVFIATTNVILTVVQALLGQPLNGREGSELPILLLQPGGALMHFYVWSLATAHLIDSSIIKSVITSCVFFVVNPKVEMAWGVRGSASYLLLVALLSSTVCSFVIVFAYLASNNYLIYMYDTDYYGNAGLIVASLVARCYISYEDKLEKLPLKTVYLVLPTIGFYLLCSTFEEYVLDSHYMVQDASFSVFSFPIAYMLIRKFDFSNQNGFFVNRTNDETEFELEMFFPTAFKPGVRMVTKSLNACIEKIFGKKASPLPYQYSQTSSIDLLQTATRQPNVVAERRRARAMKALDQKLAQISKEPERSLDEEDDEAPEDPNTIDIEN